MDKERPNIKNLVKKFKQRRRQIAEDMRESNPKRLKLAHLSSKSRIGLLSEQAVCNRFNAVHENQKGRSKMLQ